MNTESGEGERSKPEEYKVSDLERKKKEEAINRTTKEMEIQGKP